MKCPICGRLGGCIHQINVSDLDGKKRFGTGFGFKIDLLKIGKYKDKIKNFFKRS